MTSETSIHAMMRERAKRLSSALRRARRSKNALQVPGVRLLVELLSTAGGTSSTIALEFLNVGEIAPTYVDWDAVSRGDGLCFRIPPQVVTKFKEILAQAFRLQLRFNFWHFDLFLIHELLHTYQGMERGRHRGYQLRAPMLLRALDYEADALAVLSLYALLAVSPKDFLLRFDIGKLKPRKRARWYQQVGVKGIAALARTMGSQVGRFDTLASIIHAQLWHLGVFTASMVDTSKAGRDPSRSLEIASGWRFPLAKIERTFAWYLQYYRARYYRRDGSLSQMALTSEPMAEFRNLRGAGSRDSAWLKADWPRKEADYIAGLKPALYLDPTSEPAVVLALRGLRGTTRILRWVSSDSTLYRKLFSALFDSRFDRARPFFLDLFRANPWLIGFDDDPVRGSSPDAQDVERSLNAGRSRVDIVNLSDPVARRRLLDELKSVR